MLQWCWPMENATLEGTKTDTHKASPQTELVTRREAAEIARCSVETIKNWEYSGRLPALKPSSRKTLYRRSDVMKVLGLN